jgi:hypothetical protein
MATLLESFGSAVTPEVIGAVGKMLGVDTKSIERAVGTAGPLLLGGLARAGSTPAGAESLIKLLPANTDGILGSLSSITSMVGGLTGAGGSAGLLNTILGNGTNAIGAALSRKLGFNVTPLLGMAAPALLGAISKAVKSGGIDSAGLGALLGKEVSDWRANPANAETLGVIDAAAEAGREASALIAGYGADWEKVVAGPAAAMFLVASADLSGPVGSVKEAKAAHAALTEAAGQAAPNSLIAAAFASGLTRETLDTLRKVSPTAAGLMDTLKAAVAAVRSRSPGEAAAYTAIIQTVGNATANAAKEGTFLGMGGQLVSKEEQAALDRIKAAIA